ncbi:hypothetical protein HK097_002422 [Rhizophlyctis rosea]|uniref:RGS domain-containing protein n=1 Tax=Rhizophlyctis rosea TaxID=64517 RepID=A0AAD5X6J8_9FUNG|nr:hypothetical protein HK097_002422 [Rhizophlyctis rosea]
MLWTGQIGYSLYVFSFAARALRLRHLFRVNQAKLHIDLQGSGNSIDKGFRRMNAGDGIINSSKPSASAIMEEAMDPGAASMLGAQSMPVSSSTLGTRRLKRRGLSEAQIHYWTFIIVMVIVAAWCTYVQAKSEQYSVEPASYYCPQIENGRLRWEHWPFMVVSTAWSFIACPLFVWLLWKANDTYGIRRDMIVTSIATPFFTIASFVAQSFPFGHMPGEPTFPIWVPATTWALGGVYIGQWTAVALPVLESYGYHPVRRIRRWWRSYYSTFTEFATRTGEIRGRRPSTKAVETVPYQDLFRAVLEDPQWFEAFRSFSARDFTTENPMFFHEYRKLMLKVKATLGNVARDGPESESQLGLGVYLPPSTSNLPIPTVLASDFRKLYRTFIRPSAALQLNLPAHLVHQISQQLGRKDETGLPLISVFDPVRTEVLTMMFQSFSKFVEEEKEGCLKSLGRLKPGNDAIA